MPSPGKPVEAGSETKSAGDAGDAALDKQMSHAAGDRNAAVSEARSCLAQTTICYGNGAETLRVVLAVSDVLGEAQRRMEPAQTREGQSISVYCDSLMEGSPKGARRVVVGNRKGIERESKGVRRGGSRGGMGRAACVRRCREQHAAVQQCSSAAAAQAGPRYR